MTQEIREQILKRSIPEPNSGCWIWMSSIQGHGYGILKYGNQRPAHRASYEAFVGPIPDGYQIDHLCRMRCCVNPDHLEAVTQAENIRRGETGKHNSSKSNCPRGHEYSEENTHWRKYGGRGCRACERERMRLVRETKRAVAWVP